MNLKEYNTRNYKDSIAYHELDPNKKVLCIIKDTSPL